MAELSTLSGISDARTDLYNKLEKGEVPETRANIMERILRGQTSLKGELPLKALKLIKTMGGDQDRFQEHAISIVKDLAGFLEGKKALVA